MLRKQLAGNLNPQLNDYFEKIRSNRIAGEYLKIRLKYLFEQSLFTRGSLRGHLCAS